MPADGIRAELADQGLAQGMVRRDQVLADDGGVRDRQVIQRNERPLPPASELADVLEVLRALATAHGMTWEDIELQARRKRAERGGFDRRIFLEHIDQVSRPIPG